MQESPARVAFRYPNFRYYLAVRVLTVTSSEMQAVAVAWQVVLPQVSTSFEFVGGAADGDFD